MSVWYPVVGLACPVGMGLMMWVMMRGGRQQPSPSPLAHQATVDQLRAEVDELRARDRNAGSQMGVTQQHSSPRQALVPSQTDHPAMPSAITGSTHDPADHTAVMARPTRTAPA